MAKRLIVGVAVAAVMGLTVSACVKRPTTLGPDYGVAHTTIRDQQVLNPATAPNLEVVLGIEDPVSAKNTMERYRSSFERPEAYRKVITVPSVVSEGIQTR